jgi:erythronate-4-phosphate dehydrogenase
MKILVDSAMPYWENFFCRFGEVRTFRAGELAEQALSLSKNTSLNDYLLELDCLLVRSTTKVDEALLSKMPKLKFVGTATAGYDHFNIAALNARNITWYVAGGCNAQAVSQYAVCALLNVASKDDFLIKNKVFGIVGYGNVGNRVATALSAFGAKVIVYDPPKALLNDDNENIANQPEFVCFSEILKADIISIHAPLNTHSDYPSYHLFDEKALAQLTSKQYLLNAGRGELIDNHALLARFKEDIKASRASLNVILDVWEDEPNINTSLIPYLRVASAHIAGHTLEGKANGTFMLYQQLCALFEHPQTLQLAHILPPDTTKLPNDILNALAQEQFISDGELQRLVKKVCDLVYDIVNDDSVFRLHMAQFTSFVKIRQEYPIRREFSALRLIKVTNTQINELLQGIGFIISNNSTTLQ